MTPVPRLIFVLCADKQDNEAIHQEMQIIDFMMTAFKGHVFLARGTYVMQELFYNRTVRHWSDYYVNIVECCDAVYTHHGHRDHPLVDYAEEIGVPILHDYMDVELFIATTEELPS